MQKSRSSFSFCLPWTCWAGGAMGGHPPVPPALPMGAGAKHSPWIHSTQITHTLLLHLNEDISPLLLIFINKVWHYWLILGPA